MFFIENQVSDTVFCHLLLSKKTKEDALYIPFVCGPLYFRWNLIQESKEISNNQISTYLLRYM